MANKVRFLNSHKEWLKENLIRSCEKQFLMTHEAAVATVTGTSVPAFVDIGRRIVHNCPDYEKTHTFTLDDARRAFGEWLAYKAGVRMDGPIGRELPIPDAPQTIVDENCNYQYVDGNAPQGLAPSAPAADPAAEDSPSESEASDEPLADEECLGDSDEERAGDSPDDSVDVEAGSNDD